MEAWRPSPEAPSPTRNPTQFLRWLTSTHRETLEDNPIYIKTIGRGYVRFRRRLPPIARDLLAGIVFGAISLVAIHVLRRMNGRLNVEGGIHVYIIPAMAAVYLMSLPLAGFMAVFRATGFIKTTDRAMVWQDLVLSPLREEHFLWGWIWSPLVNLWRYLLLAVAFGILGAVLSPIHDVFAQARILSAPVNYFIPRLTFPWSLALLGLAVLLLGCLGMAISLGVTALGLTQSLDLGPRMFDAAGVLWGLFHLVPFLMGIVAELVAGGFLIAGAMSDPRWLVNSILYSMAGLVFLLWADWLLIHFLVPDFWKAIVSRCSVRGQTSWLRALMGK